MVDDGKGSLDDFSPEGPRDVQSKVSTKDIDSFPGGGTPPQRLPAGFKENFEYVLSLVEDAIQDEITDIMSEVPRHMVESLKFAFHTAESTNDYLKVFETLAKVTKFKYEDKNDSGTMAQVINAASLNRALGILGEMVGSDKARDVTSTFQTAEDEQRELRRRVAQKSKADPAPFDEGKVADLMREAFDG